MQPFPGVYSLGGRATISFIASSGVVIRNVVDTVERVEPWDAIHTIDGDETAPLKQKSHGYPHAITMKVV